MAGPFSFSNIGNTALFAGLAAAGGGAFGETAQAVSNSIRQPSDAQPPASAPAPLAPQPPAPYLQPSVGAFGGATKPLMIIGGLTAAALLLFLILRK